MVTQDLIICSSWEKRDWTCCVALAASGPLQTSPILEDAETYQVHKRNLRELLVDLPKENRIPS